MSTRDKILKLLKQATKPLTLEQIAMLVKAKKEDVQEELDRLFIADKIKILLRTNAMYPFLTEMLSRKTAFEVGTIFKSKYIVSSILQSSSMKAFTSKKCFFMTQVINIVTALPAAALIRAVRNAICNAFSTVFSNMSIKHFNVMEVA